MIVIDSSALIAILEHEPERKPFFHVIADADRCLINAVNYQETGQVIFSRRGANGLRDLEELVEVMQAEIIPHDADLARFSVEVFKTLWQGHPPRGAAEFLRLRGLRSRPNRESAFAV